MNNSFLIEKIEYTQIFAHKDWDGVIGGGLILRIFNLPIKFLSQVKEAKNTIIIEVPLSFDSYLKDCLVIDHHDCKKGPLGQAHFGNIVICDDKYKSVVSLIADYFELMAPENIIQALNDIESGDIDKSPLAEKMFLSYVSSISDFPYDEIANLVKMGQWDKILKWVETKSASKEAKVIKQIAQTKIKNAETLIDKVKIIEYNTEDSFDIGAARLALVQLQKQAKIGIILGKKGIYAECGIIATRRKKINLLNLFKELQKADWKAGGRTIVGGFKIPYRIEISQAKQILQQAIKSIL